MAKIKPVRESAPVEPPRVETPKTIREIAVQSEIRHQLQYVGGAWRCICGHAYPPVPVSVLLDKQPKAVMNWLQPQVEEHERG